MSELEQRLHSQHREERLAALQDLELRKNRELEASKSGWEEQIKQLSGQVHDLNNHSNQKHLNYSRGITPKRVTRGGIHLRGLEPGLHSSEEA